MESLLLGPPARRAILARTFVSPDREYHLRELVRLTGLAPRSVQQEVEKLVAAGLLAERRSGNRRYLRGNAHHPLFRPVQEIVLKTEGMAEVLRQTLTGADVEWVVVYGSMAAGSATAASDVDLLVVGDATLRSIASRLRPAQDTLGREIVPVVWTGAELRARQRRRDTFLARVLGGPIIPVIGNSPGRTA